MQSSFPDGGDRRGCVDAQRGERRRDDIARIGVELFTAASFPLADGSSFRLSGRADRIELTREPALRNLVLTNVHAPGQYRALTVRNIDAWYPAFDVKPEQKLYLAPEQRVKVW